MLGIDNYVPLMANNFEIRIYNMDGSSPTENSDLLTLSTSEIGSVEESEDIITVHYGNGLIKFPGVILFASHDHQFVETTANRIMEIVNGKLIDKITTYDEYLASDEMARKRETYEMDEGENDN